MDIMFIKITLRKKTLKAKIRLFFSFLVFLCFTKDEPGRKHYKFILFIQSLKIRIKKHAGIAIICTLPEKVKGKKKWRNVLCL